MIKKTKKMLGIEAKFDKPIEELLSNLYVDEQLSPAQIGANLGVSRKTISNWLQIYAIPVRSPNEANYLAWNSPTASRTCKKREIEIRFGQPIEEVLRCLYIEKQMNAVETGDKLGVSDPTIRKWLSGCNIPIKSQVEIKKRPPPKQEKTPKMLELELRFGQPIDNLLKHLYIEKQMSVTEIREELNTPNVFEWFAKFSIPTRSLSEAQRLSRAKGCIRKQEKTSKMLAIESQFGQPVEALLECLYIEKQMSIAEVSEKLNVPHTTTSAWLAKFKIPIRLLSEAIKIKVQKPEYRKKISGAARKRWKNPDFRQKMLDKWQDPEFVERYFAGRNRQPNKPEALISRLTPMNVKYAGDGSFWRKLPNGKHSNPDFIVEPIKETRKVIYHHGTYYHRDELHNRGQDLIDQWEQLGFDCLIIWEDELDGTEAVVSKIAEFTEQDTWQLQLF